MWRNPGRISSCVAVAAVLSTTMLFAPAPVGAQSDGNGLEETSVNTFLVDAGAGVVRVTIDITLRNVTSDRRDGNVITQTYFNAYGIAVPAGAENIVATRNGTVLDGELFVRDEGEPFSYYEFRLGQRLFNGQTTSIQVTYDHTGSPPRSELPWRANSAYASFVAFGLGDTGRVTIRLVVPIDYRFDEFTDLSGFDESEPDGFELVTYTRTELDEQFGIAVTVSNDDLLASTPLEVSGADLELRSWPDDPEWREFAHDAVEYGVPALEDLIGAAWPLDRKFDIRQTVEPNFYGYAGWFDDDASEIVVDEDLNALTMYHELAHAWFNQDFASERWLIEGLAELYAAELIELDDEQPPEPKHPPLSGLGRQPLAQWNRISFDDYTEAYGYNTSFWVMDAIADEIGFEAMADVIDAVTNQHIAYPIDGTEPETVDAPIMNWRRMLDYLELVGGSTVADEVFREYVVPSSQLDEMDNRLEQLSDYRALEQAIAPWDMPVGIRERMDIWAFRNAERLRAEAFEVIAVRDDLAELAETTGITPPDLVGDDFASIDDDFTDATAILDDQIAAGEALVEQQQEIAAMAARVGAVPPSLDDDRYANDIVDFEDATAIGAEQLDAMIILDQAIARETIEPSFVESVGLRGTDLPAVLSEARAAIVEGDLDLAKSLVGDVNATLDNAEDEGRRQLTNAGFALGGALLLLLLLLVWWWRRRRRKRRATAATEPDGSGGSIGDDDLGDREIDLDEDALAGARLGGVDDVGKVALTNPSEAAGSTGVVESGTVLGDVGNAVLELHEDVGAVIDAEPVAGAEVLIDPDAHGTKER